MLTLKTLILYLAILLTGLSAGLFAAWAISVIPGTQKVSDAVYLASMQAINRAILNPAFFVVFFGPLLALGLATLFPAHGGAAYWLLLAAGLLYLAGTVGVTALGNVPLNEQLDALALHELNASQQAQFRYAYEHKWNQLHLVRTICAILAFALTLLVAIPITKT